MNAKKIIGIVVSVLLVGSVIFTVLKPDSNDSTKNQSENSAATTTFTADQVAQHATRTDCWTIIDDSVYDITSYVPRHPGGDEILRACGTDGTTLFTQRKTTDGETVGTGTPHSNSAQSQLARLKIGELAQ